MAIIKDILIREIFDSRGEPTIEVEIFNQDLYVFRSQIPAGKSRGKNEVVVFDFEKAKESCEKFLKPEFVGKTPTSIKELDDKMIEIDGTQNKETLGGNVMLGASIAFARVLAHEKKKELWEFLFEEYFAGSLSDKKPLIFSNLINGGAHADSNLDIQEYMVVANVQDSVVLGVKELILLYRDLGKTLKERIGARRLPVGDEGGYAVDFNNNFEPLEILGKLIHDHNLESKFSLGLDVAASHFFQDGEYKFEGKACSREKLKNTYLEYIKKSGMLFSIEDPFGESDIEGFRELKGNVRDTWIVGDDLTTTNSGFIRDCAEQNLINAVIIKPNQIGTISETCEALNVARKHGLKCIISHRSGETEDSFIVHLAKAAEADGVKIGAPVRERILKFNELIRIYGA